VIGGWSEYERGMSRPGHREARARHLAGYPAPEDRAPAISIRDANPGRPVVPQATDHDRSGVAVTLGVESDRDRCAPRLLGRRARAVEIAYVHGGRGRRNDRHHPGGGTRLIGIIRNRQRDRIGAAGKVSVAPYESRSAGGGVSETPAEPGDTPVGVRRSRPVVRTGESGARDGE